MPFPLNNCLQRFSLKFSQTQTGYPRDESKSNIYPQREKQSFTPKITSKERI